MFIHETLLETDCCLLDTMCHFLLIEQTSVYSYVNIYTTWLILLMPWCGDDSCLCVFRCVEMLWLKWCRVNCHCPGSDTDLKKL